MWNLNPYKFAEKRIFKKCEKYKVEYLHQSVLLK